MYELDYLPVTAYTIQTGFRDMSDSGEFRFWNSLNHNKNAIYVARQMEYPVGHQTH